MNAIYRINEGHLILTGENWLDCTMQAIHSTRTHTSLVVTRAVIAGNRPFNDELVFQWAQMVVQIGSYQQMPPITSALPLLPDCPARETTATYLCEPYSRCQRQLTILMPEQWLLMLTCIALSTFSEEDERFWLQVRNMLDRD